MNTNSYQEFCTVLREHEIKTSSKFVCIRCHKSFTEPKFTPNEKTSIKWNGAVPYIHIGSKIYACHNGKDVNLYQKRRYAKKRDFEALTNRALAERKKIIRRTKKLNCPVSITVSRMLTLPRYKIEKITTWEKTKTAVAIREKLRNGEEIFGENLYSFNLPAASSHQNHDLRLTAPVTETMDSEIDDPPVIEEESTRYLSQFDANGYYKTDAVYLNAGAPGTDLLRMLPPIIEAATIHQMQIEMEGDAQLFQYGTENGNWQFRSCLATFLSEEYGDDVKSENLFLTAGASSGLWLIVNCLFKQGSLVFVEDPTYFSALKIFKDLNMNIIPVKTDDDGLITEDLHEKLQLHLKEVTSSSDLPLQALLYTIPVFHNPTGSVLPEERCQQLIKLSRMYGVTIVCDDVYNLLYYGDDSYCPRRLFQYDNKSDSDYCGSVISNCSFSKILAPGLRVGWFEAPEWIVEKCKHFGVLHSGGGLNPYTAGIVTSLLELGKLKPHLQKIKNIYKTNMKSIAELLKEELPSGSTLKSSTLGGYYLWIELPTKINASNLLKFSKKEYQVCYMPGSKASFTQSFENHLRICISFYPLDVLLSAVKRLCQAIKDFQSRLKNNPNFWKKYVK